MEKKEEQFLEQISVLINRFLNNDSKEREEIIEQLEDSLACIIRD